MNNQLRSKATLSAAIWTIGLYGTAHAHDGGATLDAAGTNASATALAGISCFDDGHGEAARLVIQLKDISEPVDGLLLSAQIYKGIKATSVTDPVSGDANHSPVVELEAGPGTYWVMLDKTAAGPRQFNLIWHCETADELHTGTDIVVKQFQ